MSNVLTTIVLHYEDGTTAADGSCLVEHDEAIDTIIDSNGEVVEKTSFAPGDVYHFLTKVVGNVRISRIAATHGDISSLGSVSRNRTNDLLFVELNSTDNKPSLSYSPTALISTEWIGNVGGALQINSSDLTVDIRNGSVPCLAKVEYSVGFSSYRLSHNALPLDTYEIVIVIYLEKTS